MTSRSYPPVTMPRSEYRVMRASSGREYRVMVALPDFSAESAGPRAEGARDDDAPAKAGLPNEAVTKAGYPIIYVLDGNAAFATVVESIRQRSPRPDATGIVPAIVVGIGYDTDGPYERRRREEDFSTDADEFAAFITAELRPALARDFRVDAARQTLYGHSLAGLFALRTMVTTPSAFDCYVIVSPSVWRARDEVFAGLDRVCAEVRRSDGTCLVPRAYLAVGEYEQTLAPWQHGQAGVAMIAARRQSRRMVDDARDVAGALSGIDPSGTRVAFECFNGEDHASVVLPAINRGLRFAMRG